MHDMRYRQNTNTEDYFFQKRVIVCCFNTKKLSKKTFVLKRTHTNN